MLVDGLLEQKVQLLFCTLQIDDTRCSVGQAPIGFGAYLAVVPLVLMAWWKLLYPVDQRPGAGNVVQREIAV